MVTTAEGDRVAVPLVEVIAAEEEGMAVVKRVVGGAVGIDIGGTMLDIPKVQYARDLTARQSRAGVQRMQILRDWTRRVSRRNRIDK